MNAGKTMRKLAVSDHAQRGHLMTQFPGCRPVVCAVEEVKVGVCHIQGGGTSTTTCSRNAVNRCSVMFPGITVGSRILAEIHGEPDPRPQNPQSHFSIKPFMAEGTAGTASRTTLFISIRAYLSERQAAP